MTPKIKEHIKSAFITFITEFLIYFVPAILGTTDFTKSTLFAILTMSVRAAVKEVWERVVIYFKEANAENENKTIEQTIKDINSSSTSSAGSGNNEEA